MSPIHLLFNDLRRTSILRLCKDNKCSYMMEILSSCSCVTEESIGRVWQREAEPTPGSPSSTELTVKTSARTAAGSSYHPIDGHVVVVQRHPGRAGVAVDGVVQVRVGRNSSFTGEARRRETHSEPWAGEQHRPPGDTRRRTSAHGRGFAHQKDCLASWMTLAVVSTSM